LTNTETPSPIPAPYPATAPEPIGLARFLPILHWAPKYGRSWLRGDLIGGLAVAALVVPKSLGYAGIAGVPADGRIYLPENSTRADVDKPTTKRRFSSDGQELPLSEQNRAVDGQGCDAEVATSR
jgi:hypothetical protein